MTIRVRLLSALLVASCATLIPTTVDAQTAFSVSANIGDFHLAVSNYYHVPEREVIVVRDRRVRDEEIPVVFFVAQRARVAPATIVDLRLRGLSWWDISVRYHLGADVYYVPVSASPGPPYGKAYGYYKKPRSQWKTIVLSDADVVNLVELRFLSEHYRVAPERVIELRGSHGNFVAVHQEVSGKGKGNAKKGDDNSQGNSSKGDDKKSSSSTGRGRGRGGL
jgi:hypothetical protein